MSVDINLNNVMGRVAATASQWAIDSTVYPANYLLITTDVFYTGTDQTRKFKISDGVREWADLEYFPDVNLGDASTFQGSKDYTDAEIAQEVIDRNAAINSALEGLKWKQTVRLASTANLASPIGAQTIDGVLSVVGDRILLKDQSSPAQNGIYICNVGGWTRSTDASTAAELQGAVVSVDEGTVNSDTTWRQSADNIILGTTAITWVSFGGVSLSKATTSEINTGTDNDKYIVPDQLEGSKYLNQSGSKISATATGTDTYAATITPSITAYTNTQRFFILFTNANTGAATLNLNTLGAKSIVKEGIKALVAGDIPAGSILCVAYDGTNFQIVNTRKRFVTIDLGWFAVSSIGDLQTLYFAHGLTPATGDTITGPYSMYTGIVREVWINSRSSGTPSNEDTTFKLFLNGVNAGTITTTFKWDNGAAGNFASHHVTGLAISITKDQKVSSEITTPTYATNPTNTTLYMTLLIELS